MPVRVRVCCQASDAQTFILDLGGHDDAAKVSSAAWAEAAQLLAYVAMARDSANLGDVVLDIAMAPASKSDGDTTDNTHAAHANVQVVLAAVWALRDIFALDSASRDDMVATLRGYKNDMLSLKTANPVLARLYSSLRHKVINAAALVVSALAERARTSSQNLASLAAKLDMTPLLRDRAHAGKIFVCFVHVSKRVRL